MGNNSDDGKPRPKVIEGFLKRWVGIRAYQYKSGGGKLVVVKVVGGRLKEGENLDYYKDQNSLHVAQEKGQMGKTS